MLSKKSKFGSYNRYQRESRRKSTQHSSQPTTDDSNELGQLNERLEALEKTSGGQQLDVDDLDEMIDEMGLFDDLDNLKDRMDKFDNVIDESSSKYLKIKSKLAELTEAHHKCKARHTIFKHNELKNDERFKRLECELEQERLLRKNLERQYEELSRFVHEKLKV